MAQLEMTGEGRKPRLQVPAHSCECHSHIYGPLADYPLWPGREAEPVSPVEAYTDMLARIGFERAVIVQPAAYGSDNRCTLDSIAKRGQETTRGICVTPTDVSQEELQKLHEQGIRGLRFHLMADDFALADAPSMARKIEPFGWHIQFQDEGDWIEGAVPVFGDLAVDCVIDHLGRTGKTNGLQDKGFQALLKFMETGRCWVKISAPYYTSREGAPNYSDVGERVKALVAVRPDRLVWAANWPHPKFPLDDKPEEADCLDPIADWVPDEKIRHMIFVDNPAKLYGF
jgi:D-galactarolactone isomerase